jgi:hypothetical protein
MDMVSPLLKRPFLQPKKKRFEKKGAKLFTIKLVRNFDTNGRRSKYFKTQNDKPKLIQNGVRILGTDIAKKARWTGSSWAPGSSGSNGTKNVSFPKRPGKWISSDLGGSGLAVKLSLTLIWGKVYGYN